MINLKLEDSFIKELPADPIKENYTRQVQEACFSYVEPRTASNPQLVHVSEAMLSDLGMELLEVRDPDFIKYFSGNKTIPKANPYSMCYGGHQFGHWAGQLGDGRAINIAELLHNNKRWVLQLKGAGETPYSRTADGLAVLRSSVREHLCSEAMHHLGVPTTRSLSLVLSGDRVLRDMLYDGNSAYEQGAIVCRASPSFIRFGSFEIFAARNDVESLRKLTDYTIKYFYKHILVSSSKDSYLEFFREVCQKTIAMVVGWQRVGFVHGVMNTDNMSILGLTIDYGPYGWLEDYNPNWTPNTTDSQHKRYAFGNQIDIAIWNLSKLAAALYPLIEDISPLEQILNDTVKLKNEYYNQMICKKLGLIFSNANVKLFEELETLLSLSDVDMTIFFRSLSNIRVDSSETLDVLSVCGDAFYSLSRINDTLRKSWASWLNQYIHQLKDESSDDRSRKGKMNLVNPKYVLRNYMAQQAIDAADKGDYSLIEEMHVLLKEPYEEQTEYEQWFAKRPEWANNKIGCSMLSCSS